MPKRTSLCGCAEASIEMDGRRIRTGLNAHDCRYIAQRNSLIPEAMAMADSKYPQTHSKDPSRGEKWSQEFMRQMNVLAGQYKIKGH